MYEAEDLELRVRVALKTVRPDADEKAHAVERFERQIQLARPRARERALALEKDARGRGFGLVARRAAALSGKTGSP